MPKMIDNEGVVYYDRAIIKKIYGQGYHFVNDLLPLYHMASYLKKYNNLSKQAKQRVKWFDYYRQCHNASKTCRYFGISRQCFYEWYRRYDPNNLYTLENQSTAPIRKRRREITPKQEMRIVQLRKRYIRYGKIKIAKIYEREYQEKISSWKVQKVIEKYKLYRNPVKTAETTRKRLKAVKKKRITELKKRPKTGFLLCLDAVEIRWNNLKRFIFTGIDYFSKVAFARMYENANSYNAADFLNRLLWLVDGKVENIQTDNGSEFEKYFNQACQKSELARYYNRPRTPKDNPVNERFNRTLQDEFVDLGNFTPDVVLFNKRLTEWLIEYDFKRPHESLNYETPINFNNSTKVSPMYPSGTRGLLKGMGGVKCNIYEICNIKLITFLPQNLILFVLCCTLCDT
jgi:transposase InsO family protein